MYENLIDPQIQILERCQVAWDNIMPDLPEGLSPYGVPSLTKSWVKKSLLMVIAKLKQVKLPSEEDVNPFLIQSITQNFPGWTTPLEGWIASAPSTVPNIASHLNARWSQFQAYYIELNKEELQKLTSENKRLQLRVNELLNTTTTLESRKNELNEALELAAKLLDLAITNFDENPLRLMTKESAKDAHPLSGAMDDKTIIEVIEALSDRVRK